MKVTRKRYFFYFQIPITLKKEQAGVDINGEKILKCGFKIGGGIDQNYMKSPQGYSDNVIFAIKLCFIMNQLKIH